jgi:hypothetical protein
MSKHDSKVRYRIVLPEALLQKFDITSAYQLQTAIEKKLEEPFGRNTASDIFYGRATNWNASTLMKMDEFFGESILKYIVRETYNSKMKRWE